MGAQHMLLVAQHMLRVVQHRCDSVRLKLSQLPTKLKLKLKLSLPIAVIHGFDLIVISRVSRS